MWWPTAPCCGRGGSSAPYDEMEECAEWVLLKNREDAMSEDIGDDERVVVLGRAVEGRELVCSVRGLPFPGADDGRTTDIDERD